MRKSILTYIICLMASIGYADSWQEVEMMSDFRDYTFSVVSDHGLPVPAVGTYNDLCWGSTVTCSVGFVVSEGDIQWVCSGWSGVGSVPVAGDMNVVGEVVLTNQSSSIEWQWKEGLFSGGLGSVDDPYQIATKLDLLTMASSIDNYDKCFVMVADIDLAETSFDTAPIAPDYAAPFTGVFDGDGYVVSNMFINASNEIYVGLFGYSTGVITRLHIACCVVSNTGNLVSGLCGYNKGLIKDCSSTGCVFGEDDVGGLCGNNKGIIVKSCAMGCVLGESGVGGLCGDNSGTIINSCSTGSARGDYAIGGFCGSNYFGSISNSYSFASVEGNQYHAGGFCGINQGMISDSYATGSVSGHNNCGGFCGRNRNSINDCYSTGSVSGDNYCGGFCGYYTEGTIFGCFWDTQTSGFESSAGGTGKTTLEMKTKSFFDDAGWDFYGESYNGTNDIWVMDGYPVFIWQVDESNQDLDGDGMNDSWELAKFGTLEYIASADNDLDGFSNIQEYIAGTDPTLASSRFVVNSLSRTQECNAVSWTAVDGRVYDVFWTSSLSREFILLESGISYPVNSFSDVLHSSRPAGFYTVKVRLPGGDDSDGDGLPDTWESEFFLGSTSAVAGFDSDGDGYSNVQEYLAGTNPTNATSFFKVTLDKSPLLLPEGGIIIKWNAVEGRYYNVLWAPDLNDSFISLESNIEYPANCYTDRVHSVEQKGYYRVDAHLKE